MKLPANRNCLMHMTKKAIDALAFVGPYNGNMAYRGMCAAATFGLLATPGEPEADRQECLAFLKWWIFFNAPKAELIGKQYWPMNIAGYQERHKCLTGILSLAEWVDEQQKQKIAS